MCCWPSTRPTHGQTAVRILKGGFHDAPYGVGKELANAAPLIMTGLPWALPSTGLFNIGAAGQYTLGAYGALYCAIMLKLPWFVCLLAAAILGRSVGCHPRFLQEPTSTSTKSITSIMFNWIGLYLVNELVYQNSAGPMYDVRNTPHPEPGQEREVRPSLSSRTSA